MKERKKKTTKEKEKSFPGGTPFGAPRGAPLSSRRGDGDAAAPGPGSEVPGGTRAPPFPACRAAPTPAAAEATRCFASPGPARRARSFPRPPRDKPRSRVQSASRHRPEGEARRRRVPAAVGELRAAPRGAPSRGAPRAAPPRRARRGGPGPSAAAAFPRLPSRRPSQNRVLGVTGSAHDDTGKKEKRASERGEKAPSRPLAWARLLIPRVPLSRRNLARAQAGPLARAGAPRAPLAARAQGRAVPCRAAWIARPRPSLSLSSLSLSPPASLPLSLLPSPAAGARVLGSVLSSQSHRQLTRLGGCSPHDFGSPHLSFNKSRFLY